MTDHSTFEPGKGAPALSQIATRAAIEHLKSVLPNANYCCGGSIPITSTSPVTIRYDNTSTSSIHKIHFPSPNSSSSSDNDLNNLLLASERATFGLDGKDVLDETYRKAAALDTDRFSTNFHPADHGVLDALSQVLLPDYGLRVNGKRKELWGVKAELYKLNMTRVNDIAIQVYSGPSGKFEKHVDTPRGTLQFGSLVVCLPYEHQGGALLVTHRDHTNTFDWSSASTAESETSPSPVQIKWAAFYSDCTHEVQPVITGHRVTLTYNLYISPYSIGSPFTLPPTIDASSYPLSAGAREMLSQNGFMPEGGTLGFFCTHQYAHATAAKGQKWRPRGWSDDEPFGTEDTAEIEQLMPYALKGVDAMLFQTFVSLGVNVTAKPVMDQEIFEQYYEWHRDDLLDREQRIKQLKDIDEKTRKQMLAEIMEKGKIPAVGTRFWGMQFTNREYGENAATPQDLVGKMWPYEEKPGVVWLNDPIDAGWQPAIAYVVCGNNASLEWRYSHATILIDIPPRNERLVDIPEGGFPIDPSKYERGSEKSTSD
ncbi:hypothetical protein ACMFMG_006378 [Clarireedia jacksonii]